MEKETACAAIVAKVVETPPTEWTEGKLRRLVDLLTDAVYNGEDMSNLDKLVYLLMRGHLHTGPLKGKSFGKCNLDDGRTYLVDTINEALKIIEPYDNIYKKNTLEVRKSMAQTMVTSGAWGYIVRGLQLGMHMDQEQGKAFEDWWANWIASHCMHETWRIWYLG